MEMEKLLVFTVTLPGGTPVNDTTVSVVVVLDGLETHDPVQSVTR